MPGNAARTIDPWVSAPKHNRSLCFAHPVCPSRPAGGSAPQTHSGTQVHGPPSWSRTTWNTQLPESRWLGKRDYRMGRGLYTALACHSHPTCVLRFPGLNQSFGPAGTCRKAHGIFGEHSCFCHRILPRVDLKTLSPDFQLRHKDPCPLREKGGRLLR